jgi:hypothetical protein
MALITKDWATRIETYDEEPIGDDKSAPLIGLLTRLFHEYVLAEHLAR